MRALGLTRERLEKQYQDWIELSCDPNISVSFFIIILIYLSLSTLSVLQV